MTDDRPPRPDPLPVEDTPLPELDDREVWICWRYKWKDDRDEWTKVPVNPNTGYNAKSDEPDTWTTRDAAEKYHEREDTDTDGLGVMFPADDFLAGIDLDDCRDPESGELAPWAVDVLDDVHSYAEVSPSGTGIHVLTFALHPGDGNRADVDDAEGHVEMYDEGRYFTFTGRKVEGAPGEVRQQNEAYLDVHDEYIADDEDEATGTDGSNPGESADGTGSGADLTDKELLEKARNAENGDKFRRLYDDGDTSGYPSHSEADQALCCLLAFWTGGDESQMDRLFRRSALVRDKWTEREDYRERTIENALEQTSEVYDGGESEPEGESPSKETFPDTDAAADGGATTAESADESDSPDPELSRFWVASIQGVDDVDDVDYLKARERAYAVWRLMERTGNDRVLALPDDGPLYAYHSPLWREDGKQRLREHASQALGQAYSTGVLTELTEWVRIHNTVERDELGADKWELPLANGVLDVRDRELRDPEPDDYLTDRFGYGYDPDAEAPRFQQFLQETVDEDDRAKLQEYAGYCLHHWGQPFKKALFLIGDTDSGKGTFIRVLKALVGGQENVANERLHDLMGSRWGAAQLFGKWVNLRNEVTMDSDGDDPDRFKELVGAGDTISAERKGEQKFEFEVTQKFVFSCNRFPDITAADEAFYNRLLFVQMPTTVPEERQDPELVEKLKDELPGILNWALDGFDRLHEKGAFTGERRIETKKDLQKAHGSTIDRFVHNCLKTTGDRDDVLHKSETFALYNRFCEWVDDDPVGSQSKFTRELKTFADIDDGNTTVGPTAEKADVYTGVRVREEAIDEIVSAEAPRRSASEYDVSSDATGLQDF